MSEAWNAVYKQGNKLVSEQDHSYKGSDGKCNMTGEINYFIINNNFINIFTGKKKKKKKEKKKNIFTKLSISFFINPSLSTPSSTSLSTFPSTFQQNLYQHLHQLQDFYNLITNSSRNVKFIKKFIISANYIMDMI